MATQGYVDNISPDTVFLEALLKQDALAVLCCPLAQDPQPGVQAASLECLAKLAASDKLLSEAVVSCGILDSILISLSHEAPVVKAAANSVLTSVARASPDFAGRLLSANVVSSLTQQLQGSNDAVREAAVKTISALVQSSEEHANAVFGHGVADLLVTLLAAQDTTPGLVKAITQTFAGAAAANSNLAQLIVTHGALKPLTQLLAAPFAGPDVKAAAHTCLSHVAKHGSELANQVASTGAVAHAVRSLTEKGAPALRRSAASLLFELASKDADLADEVVAAGVPNCLPIFLKLDPGGEGSLLAASLLGQMGSYRSRAAKAVVDAGACQVAIDCLSHGDPGVSGTGAWAVEQLANHGPDTAMPLIERHALQQAMTAFSRADADSELRVKLKAAIKALLHSCTSSAPLEPLVDSAIDPEILKPVLVALQPLLAADPKSRQRYVSSGALMRMQGLEESLDDKSRTTIAAINGLFPADVVAYYRDA